MTHKIIKYTKACISASFSIVLLLSCSQNPENRQVLPARNIFFDSGSHYTGLPAWEQEWEKKKAGKADKFSDYRAQHPELYSVTAAPEVNVRPFSEFEPAQAVMMSPGGSISDFHKAIITGLNGHVGKIVIFITSDTQKNALKKQLMESGIPLNIFEFFDVQALDAIWTRDYGPISILTEDNRVGFIDNRYYYSRMYDDAIPTKLAVHWNINVFRPSISLEGGNFMADVNGTCYATEKIFQQNPGHSAEEIDAWMLEYAGCKKLVIVKWPKGLGTGHIDMFSKLMNNNTVILGYYDPLIQPENAKLMDDNEDIFKSVITAENSTLTVLRIPLPYDWTGIWFTYTNSLIVNDVLLMPVFSQFQDLEKEATDIYVTARPDLTIIKINSDDIIPSGGAIHCVTMTVPQGKLEKFQKDPEQLCKYNEINECLGISPCSDFPYEGICDGNILKYCNSDGYPAVKSCYSCCAWDPEALNGAGIHDCLYGDQCNACIDECKEGEHGCSAYKTHEWECVKSSAEGCFQRKYARCEGSKICNPDTSGCQWKSFIDPCDGISLEGMCEGKKLKYCEKGIIQEKECGENECCAWDSSKEYYRCLKNCKSCIAECKPSEFGCSKEQTHQWKCRPYLHSSCHYREYSSCFPEKCNNGTCPDTCKNMPQEGICDNNVYLFCENGKLNGQDCALENKICKTAEGLKEFSGCTEPCTDECSEQDSMQCSEDGLYVQTCIRDQWNCLKLFNLEQCPGDTKCLDGTCRSISAEEPDAAEQDISAEEQTGTSGACNAGMNHFQSPSMLLILFLFAGFIYYFRRFKV